MPPAARLSSRLRLAPTRYEPISRLAAGGMAEVWRAEAVFEDGTRHPVAVKRVLPDLARQDLYRSMFEDEARLGILLRHPCVVRVYDAREVGGTFIMIMELVEGTTLKAILDEAQQREAPMRVPAALFVLRQLARALAYAHGATDRDGTRIGLVHRDVSPHNLLLGRNGAVKLADFGLANASVNQTVRSEYLVGGKLGYVAPEVVRQDPGDRRVDLFAAGVVLWEMLAGRRLFVADTDTETVRNVIARPIEALSTINAAVPSAVDALAMDLLERDPRHRIKSASDLVHRLEEILRDVDPAVGERDIALLVGLHTAHKKWASEHASLQPPVNLNRLTEELEAFVVAAEASSASTDIGHEPLDPDAFGPLRAEAKRRGSCGDAVRSPSA